MTPTTMTDKCRLLLQTIQDMKAEGLPITPGTAARQMGHDIASEIGGPLKYLEAQGYIRRVHHSTRRVEIIILKTL